MLSTNTSNQAQPEGPYGIIQQEKESLANQFLVEWIDPHLLSPHPRQTAIYGEEKSTDLLAAIQTSRWIKPLVITQQNIIISGHQRWKAALMLEWHAIPVERHTFASAVEEVEALLLENWYREKTAEQRAREGGEWEQIEGHKARLRMSKAAQEQKSQGRQNFADPEQGRTREKVAERVGFGSGFQYEKAAKVVRHADQLSEAGNGEQAQALLTVLNQQSVDAAAQVLKLDGDEQTAVLQKLAQGECTRVKAAVVEVRKEALEAQAQAEPEKPRILHASFEDWLEDAPTCDLLLTDPPYSTDVEDIDSFARAWLPLALAKVKSTGRAYVCIGAYPRELRAYLSINTGLPLVQVLAWSYLNTIGPAPAYVYKHNWQAILAYCGPDAPPLDCPLLMEQMSAMQINAPDGRQGERYHAWQKPDALAERLIRHATRPGDLVLDCFAGTGTFLLAAHRLGRTALGCERSPGMLVLAKRRGCEIVEGKAVLDEE